MNFHVTITLTLMSLVAAIPPGYESFYKQKPAPYYFDYQVHDDYQRSHYTHKENSDGKNVHGSYTVALPDGRKQTVEYTADHHRGFVAKVTYKGKANHPQNYGPSVSFGSSYHQASYQGPHTSHHGSHTSYQGPHTSHQSISTGLASYHQPSYRPTYQHRHH